MLQVGGVGLSWIWTEPALNDLDAIADYIALDNPAAARDPVRECSTTSIS
jgi:plasmid stabilization system protein ParE